MQATITDTEYSARQDTLDTLTTPALRKARAGIRQEVAAAKTQGPPENLFSLTCLLEWADGLIEGRKNGYTGAYEA